MKEKIRVMKFGGTSVGDAECIERAAEIIAGAARECTVVAVVSAMSGVTNHLIEAAHKAAEGDEHDSLKLTSALRSQHIQAVESIVARDGKIRAELTDEVDRIITEAENLCRGSSLLRELTARSLASISSIGERLSARLMATALRELEVQAVAVEATELIVTDDQYAQAEPLMEETQERSRARLSGLFDEHIVPVVTGFIGATSKGMLTTLGRGGSDYSATILGAALGAKEIIIWTDVDGILTADPRLVPEARTLNEISYNEAAELAHFGAKVLHPKTLRPVVEADITVWIRNSFKPNNIGTKITRTGHPTNSGVKAITAISNVSLITVGGRGIVGAPDVVAKTFTATASVRANVLLISQASSQNDICFIVDSRDAEPTLEALRRTFSFDLDHSRVEHITVDSNIAVVAVVGEKMRGTIGVSGRTFNALGDAHVNIIAIAQGSSEYNISFVVASGDMGQAVVAVHREFGLDRHPALDRHSASDETKVTKAGER